MLPRGCPLAPVGGTNRDKSPSRLGNHSGHVEARLSRFVGKPGLKVLGISNGPLVPVPEPGQMGLWNRDKWAFFY